MTQLLLARKAKGRASLGFVGGQLFEALESRQLMTVNPPTSAGPWSAALVDEFDSLNTNVWTNGRTWGNSNVTASGIFSPKDATVSNGALTLSGQNQSGVGTDNKTYPLTSGLIQSGGIQGVTAPGFEFQYGYVDIRAKANSGSGFWTAGYLLPVSHQDGYEVDIVENKGIQPNTYFGGYHDWRDGTWDWGSTPLSFNDTQAYHDYAVDWEPGSLTFYVDGKEVRSYSGSDVPSQPMYLILNLDAGPYAGDTTKALSNDGMSVDSVGVWQHTPDYYLAGQGVGALANPAANQFGNASFEQENVHGDSGASYAYHTSDPYWTFNDHSGLAANGSAFNNTNAPDGSQVAFLQGVNGAPAGRISQTLNITAAGTYNISFQAAKRTDQQQPIEVSVDGKVIATITPDSTSFASYTSPNFNLTKGSHTITFSATDTSSDNTSFIDNVKLNDPPPVVQSVPPVLAAKTESPATIDLTWTPGSTLATGYPIEISTDGVSYKTIATAAAGATSYQVTGLNPATQYDFEIVAADGSETPLLSNVAQATTAPLPLAAPSAPSNLAASAASPTSVNLTWTAGSGGGSASGFAVSISTDGTHFTNAGNAASGATSFQMTNLQPSTKYSFELTASNSAGTSPASNIAAATTSAPPLAAPSAPSNLTASSASPTSVNLTWKIGASGGAASGFPIEMSTDGKNFQTIATAPAGATSYQVTGLSASTSYTFRVSAANASGTSAPSNSSAAATPANSSGTLPTGWSSADIGSPAISGTTSYNAGIYTLSSDGLDIWGKTDQFRFVSTQAVGDATLVARVTSQTNTGATAKAGLMFRASADPSSPFVDLVQTPAGGVRLQWRDVTSGASAQMIGTAYTNPVWLKLERSGNNFTGYASTDGMNYSKIGTVTVGLPAQSLAGLAVSSFSAQSASTAVFDNVNLQTANPWMSTDIGAPAVKGSATFSAGFTSITLTGSGTGIRGSADQFHFADQMTSGNITVSAQLRSQSATNVSAKSGVMIRANSDSNSAYVAVTRTAGNRLSFEYRTATGAASKSLGNLTAPVGAVDLKLVRTGNTFTGYYSTDGVNFHQLGSVTISMGTNTFAGIVTTSNDASATNAAVFANVNISRTAVSVLVIVTHPRRYQ